MFNVVVDRGKRRAWSARTVAVSVGAHLVVLVGIAVAATNTRAAPPDESERDTIITFPVPEPEKSSPPAPVKPAMPQPAPASPEPAGAPPLEAPDSVPTRINPPNPGETPQPPDPGAGPAGPGSGILPAPQPPAGGTGPLRDFRDSIFDPKDLEQLPQLLNPREAQRMLERVYPSLLRDARVTGHTTVLLVIDRNGMVQPGSVTVQETSHEAFREAAVRAAERFRFRPAMLDRQPISVRISLPIEWTIQR